MRCGFVWVSAGAGTPAAAAPNPKAAMLPETKVRRLIPALLGSGLIRLRTVPAPVPSQHPHAKKDRRGLPGIGVPPNMAAFRYGGFAASLIQTRGWHKPARGQGHFAKRSEERRVGKECRSRWSADE